MYPTFKHDRYRDEIDKAHPMVGVLFVEFMLLSMRLGKEAVVTRVMESVPGFQKTSIHSQGYAIDFRDERFSDGEVISKLYEPEEIEWLLDQINQKFPRNDGKKTAIYHDAGLGGHFHLQWCPNAGVYVTDRKEAQDGRKVRSRRGKKTSVGGGGAGKRN